MAEKQAEVKVTAASTFYPPKLRTSTSLMRDLPPPSPSTPSCEIEARRCHHPTPPTTQQLKSRLQSSSPFSPSLLPPSSSSLFWFFFFSGFGFLGGCCGFVRVGDDCPGFVGMGWLFWVSWMAVLGFLAAPCSSSLLCFLFFGFGFLI